MRHVYVLIVDCPERDDGVIHDLTALADKHLTASARTRTVITEVVVPPDGLQPALRPRVILEEVRRHQPPEERDASER